MKEITHTFNWLLPQLDFTWANHVASTIHLVLVGLGSERKRTATENILVQWYISLPDPSNCSTVLFQQHYFKNEFKADLQTDIASNEDMLPGRAK